MTTNEHSLARALVEAHVDPAVAPVVLDAIDGWASVVQRAQAALEQAERSSGDLNRYYTIAELRLLLKKSDSGVRALIDNGTLPVTRINEGRNGMRVPIEAVERYLAEHTSQNTQAPRRAPRPRRSVEDAAAIQQYPWLVD